jgi:hypothetical protein
LKPQRPPVACVIAVFVAYHAISSDLQPFIYFQFKGEIFTVLQLTFSPFYN